MNKRKIILTCVILGCFLILITALILRLKYGRPIQFFNEKEQVYDDMCCDLSLHNVEEIYIDYSTTDTNIILLLDESYDTFISVSENYDNYFQPSYVMHEFDINEVPFINIVKYYTKHFEIEKILLSNEIYEVYSCDTPFGFFWTTSSIYYTSVVIDGEEKTIISRSIPGYLHIKKSVKEEIKMSTTD